jgi:hypothetical protein
MNSFSMLNHAQESLTSSVGGSVLKQAKQPSNDKGGFFLTGVNVGGNETLNPLLQEKVIDDGNEPRTLKVVAVIDDKRVFASDKVKPPLIVLVRSYNSKEQMH